MKATTKPVDDTATDPTPDPTVVQAVDWAKMLDQVRGGESGMVKFLKPGRHKFRALSARKGEYFIDVKAEYQGRRKTKFLLLGFDPQAIEEGVKALLVPKTVMTAILQLATEGYDLFSIQEGRGITIVKEGSGLNTEYAVLPSPQPVAVPQAIRDELKTVSLEMAAQQYETFQATRAEGRADRSGEGGDGYEEGPDGPSW